MENDLNTKPPSDDTTMLVGYFEASEEATIEARAVGARARDYYDGKQLTDKERKDLRARKQPDIVWNKVKRKINFLTGYEIQQRTDPKAFPRNYPADEEAAAAASDALRFVQDTENLPEKFSDAFENGVVEGFGGVEVRYDPKKGRPTITHVPWDRLFYDPFSSKHDFSDAQYVGIVVWMDEDRAVQQYKGKEKIITDTIASEPLTSTDKTHDDKPSAGRWVAHGKRKRVRICQIYYRKDGNWHWAHFTKSGILSGGAEVPFKNEDDESECPLQLWSCYVDRDNARYGEVAELFDIQDAINKREARLLYSITMRQAMYEKGAIDSVEATRKELARPDGMIAVSPNKRFELLASPEAIAGQVQLLQEAKREMEFAGPNASLMGDTNAGASGRAIIAAQQGGLSELGRAMARYRHFKLRVYRQIWNRIKQFWRAEKWVRVTDNERNVRFVGLNVDETQADVMMASLEQEQLPPEQKQQLADRIKATPELQVPTGRKKNNVGEMDVDIIIDETVDTITIQQEQFQMLVELAKSGSVPLPPEVLIRASQFRNKDEILEAMKGAQAPAVPPEVQEAQSRSMAADVVEREAKADKAKAEASSAQIAAMDQSFDLGHKFAAGPDANAAAPRSGDGGRLPLKGA